MIVKIPRDKLPLARKSGGPEIRKQRKNISNINPLVFLYMYV